ncbi:cell wall bioproteinsis and architecture protein [Rhodotorula kratochvilovae]
MSRSYPSERPAAPNAPPPRKKRTILDLHALKRKNVPITMLTAYDFPSARFVEAAAHPVPASPAADPSSTPAYPRGVDICLVGDSLAMVACGYTSTSDLTLDEMLYHCRSVARGCTTSLLLADLPFGTYYASVDDGVRAAVRLVQEGRMDAVKIEGGQEIVPLVRRLTDVGIPVMPHIGLTPQRQAALSGYRVQGKTVSSALKVWRDAQALQDAGAFALLVEAVPSRLAEWMTERLRIPTIGIGAGARASGQVLVQLDMLGVDSDLGAEGKGPRFLRRYADVGAQARQAVQAYVEDVRMGAFPVEGEHTYPMSDEAFEGFLARVEEEDKAAKTV